MAKLRKPIHQIDLMRIGETDFKRRYVSCLVLTQNSKIMLQQRGEDWDHFPGFLSTFGGRIESGETPMQALVRELNEELGADVKVEEVVSLGAIAEGMTNYSELVYVYFWHDLRGTIKGCYEGEAKYYESIESILAHPKVTDDVYWLLKECQYRKLLNLNSDNLGLS